MKTKASPLSRGDDGGGRCLSAIHSADLDECAQKRLNHVQFQGYTSRSRPSSLSVVPQPTSSSLSSPLVRQFLPPDCVKEFDGEVVNVELAKKSKIQSCRTPNCSEGANRSTGNPSCNDVVTFNGSHNAACNYYSADSKRLRVQPVASVLDRGGPPNSSNITPWLVQHADRSGVKQISFVNHAMSPGFNSKPAIMSCGPG